MDGLLRKMLSFDMEDMKTNVDIVLTIDATRTMWPVWEMLEAEALCFYDKLLKIVKADGMKSIGQLRVKVIWFRDFYYTGDYAYGESDFFRLPDEKEKFRDFIASMRLCSSGPEEESALEALTMAMRSDFDQGGTFRRHIIVLFTDAGAHPLEDYDKLIAEARKRGCKPTIYPPNMPRNLDEFITIWNKEECSTKQEFFGNDGHPTKLDVTGRRLVMFATDNYPWADMEIEMNYTIRKNVECGCGGREEFDKEINVEEFFSLVAFSIVH